MRRADRLGWTLAALCCSLCACGPRLGPRLVAQHPKLLVQPPAQQRLAASAPQPPVWLREAPPARAGVLPFIGRAAAPTLDEARAAAGRELLEAVSAYVGVSVASRFEVVEVATSAGPGSTTARGEVKTAAANALARLQPEEEYWERLAAAPAGAESVRCALLAWVPRDAIEQARAERASAGKLRRAVLLARTAGCAEAALLDADLALRLRANGLQVAALAAGGPAALPVVRGTCSASAGALRVDWTLEVPGEPAKSASLSRPAAELFALEADLAAAVGAALGSQR